MREHVWWGDSDMEDGMRGSDIWVCECGWVGSKAGRHLHDEETHETDDESEG